MIYATTNHIGDISNAQNKETRRKQLYKQIGEFSHWIQKPKDAGKKSKGQKETRSDRYVADGF